MKPTSGKHNKSALLILEEAIHFLRLAPTTLILSYYVGSLPFILGLLYFWTDMSRYGYAADHLAVGSLGIALLFAWMKFWQAVFGMQIRSKLFGTSQQSWSMYRFFFFGGIPNIDPFNRIVCFTPGGIADGSLWLVLHLLSERHGPGE